ncbi:MAG: LamG domain-containing protein [Cryobacterium sp.]|nr:LamG domain-containing protein [Oligoflexia bacterium]
MRFYKFFKTLSVRTHLILSLVSFTSCDLTSRANFIQPEFLPGFNQGVNPNVPSVAALTILDASPTKNVSLNLSWGGAVLKTGEQYCLLENSVDTSICIWRTGSLPTVYPVSAGDGPFVLRAYFRNTIGLSTVMAANAIEIDRTAPTLASATVTNTNPTTTTLFQLSYGAVSGIYERYCILENDSVFSHCNFITGSLPSSYSVTSIDGAKALYLWIKDAAGNVSLRVDTPSVTYSSAPITPFTEIWNFAFATASDFIFDASKIEFNASIAKLISHSYVDNDANIFGSSAFVGVVRDSTAGVLKLGSNGGCDGRVSLCDSTAELDGPNVPRPGNLVGYWKFNGTGAISDGSAITATIGSNGVAANTSGTLTYASGRVGSGISFAADSGRVVLSAPGIDTSPNAVDTFSAWMNWDGTYGGSTFRMLFGFERYDLGMAQANTCFGFNTAGGDCRGIDATGLANRWIHVVAIFNHNDSTLNRIFLNGTEQVLTQRLGSPSYPSGITSSFIIGGWSHDYNYPFSGKIDDVAVWNVALTPAEIKALYERQSSFGGRFTSRVMSGLSPSDPWTALSWNTPIPFGKNLPDANCSTATCLHAHSERSVDYADLVGRTGTVGDDDLMSGIVGLWHLDEANGTLSVKDDSGNANGGTSYGALLGVAGKLGNSAVFNGNTAYIDAGTDSSLTGIAGRITVQAWVNVRSLPAPNTVATLFERGYDGYNEGTFLRIYSSGGTPQIHFGSYLGGSGDHAVYYNSDADTLVGKWLHVVGTYDGTRWNLYLNGVLTYSNVDPVGALATSAKTTFGAAYIQGRAMSQFLDGSLDEVAVWNRSLNAAEVQQLYRRGVNRVKFQVRSCTLSDCSDGVWKGKNGNSGSYFTERENTNTPGAAGGSTLPGAAYEVFSDFSGLSFTAPYFQYRMVLETDDSSNSPALSNVTLAPHFDSSAPSVVSKNGIPFYSLSNFAETLGTSCAGGIGYQLSLDKTTWYWWDLTANSGSGKWVISDGSVGKSNSIAVSNAHFAAFKSDVGSAGSLFVKAFLKSNGIQACELDSLSVTGIR